MLTEILNRFMFQIKEGDALIPDPGGHKVCIAHVVNDIGKFGAGFALSMHQTYPGAKKGYLGAFRVVGDDNESLRGKNILTKSRHPATGDKVYICHMVAQRGLRSKTNPHPLNLDDLRSCLRDLCTTAWTFDWHVQMPKIGSGLGGGNWQEIEPIIRAEMRSVNTTIYTLP